MSNYSGNSSAMTSRQRVLNALSYQQVDRVPVDLGGTLGTGAHVSVIANLRQALGLDAPGTPVKVVEPYQMLGEVAADLRQMLCIDTVNLPGPRNHFGFADADFKPWRTFDGTNVLVAGKFNTEPEPNGDILQYPQGDKTAPASGRMPKGGYYFDDIVRQEPIDESKLDPADNLEDFAV
ncbi:MAG: uroporphyrinogen decarboxylase family protein, partial [Planctomycetota bacterium]